MKTSFQFKQKRLYTGILTSLVLTSGGFFQIGLQAQCQKTTLSHDTTIVKTDTAWIVNSSAGKTCCASVCKSDSAPLFILNGKFITKKEFDKVAVNGIERIEILKGDKAIAAYGNKGKNGVIIAETKQDQKLKDALIVLDGTPISREEMDNLQMSRIKSVTILKGTAASTIYGEKATMGAIVISTKGKADSKQKIQTSGNNTTGSNNKGNSSAKTAFNSRVTAEKQQIERRNQIQRRLMLIEKQRQTKTARYRKLQKEKMELEKRIRELSKQAQQQANNKPG